jgi:hypothetical protein
MAGVNFEQHTWDRLLAQRNGLIFPDATDLNLALGTASTITGGYERWNVLGTFTRLDYSYDDRYLLEFTGRYDGSSKFPTDQRFAFFPSCRAPGVSRRSRSGGIRSSSTTCAPRLVGHDGNGTSALTSSSNNSASRSPAADERHEAKPDERAGRASERLDVGNGGHDERRSRFRHVEQPPDLQR